MKEIDKSEDTMSSYQDIIDLSRPKSKHPSMSLNNRAAQFAPFSALTGYDEKIKEVARETVPKKELEEDQKEIIDTKLQFLLQHKDEEIVAEIPELRGQYERHFVRGDGSYIVVTYPEAVSYLTDNGVDGDQILLEDRSHNTWENIRFTQELLEQEGVDASQVVVVSNGFHLTRVRMLWGRVWEGEYTLSTLAAPSSHVPSRLKMYIREPLALVKSYFFDR